METDRSEREFYGSRNAGIEMALVACPECKVSISDVAASCPHCGHPATPKSLTQIVVEPKEGLFLQFMNFGCMLVLLVAGTAVVAFVFFQFMKR